MIGARWSAAAMAPVDAGAQPAAPAPRPLLGTGRRFAVAVAGCLVLAALLRPVPPQFKYRNGGDCVRYLTWGQVVRDRGLAAFPILVDEYRHRWVGFPPPTRWTWLLSIGGLMRLWRSPGDVYHPIVLLAWLGGVLSIIPLALWLRRLFAPEVVVLSLLLFATSPLLRGMSHFPLPDSASLVLTIGLFACASEWLFTPRRWLLWALGVLAFLSVTWKETGLFSVIAAAAISVWGARRTGRLRPAPLVAMLGGCVAALAVTIPLAGGPTQFALLVQDYVRGNLNTGNKALVSGPYYRYLVDLMIVAPAMLVTALVSLVPLLGSHAFGAGASQLLWAAVPTLALNSMLSKSIRYAMPVDVCLRALCAGAVWLLFSSGERWRRAAAAVLLVTLLAHDMVLHALLWGQDQVYDPVTWMIARALHMIPWN
jgi:hypothetical protein